MSCTSASIRADPLSPQHGDRPAGSSPSRSSPARTRVVDVVVDVRNPVDHAHDPALERRRHLGARLEWRAIPSRTCSVRLSPRAVALRARSTTPQRVLVVAKVAPERSAQARVEHLLADVPERRVPEVVAERRSPPRGPRSGRSARATVREIVRHLERVGQPRAVVVALGRDEHLRLVRQPAERLRWTIRSRSRWNGVRSAQSSSRARAGPDRSAPRAATAAAPLLGDALGERRADGMARGRAHGIDCGSGCGRGGRLYPRRGASLCAPSASATQCAHFDSAGSSAEHRRPAARRRQLGDRGGVDPQVHPALVQRGHVRGRDEAPADAAST